MKAKDAKKPAPATNEDGARAAGQLPEATPEGRSQVLAVQVMQGQFTEAEAAAKLVDEFDGLSESDAKSLMIGSTAPLKAAAEEAKKRQEAARAASLEAQKKANEAKLAEQISLAKVGHVVVTVPQRFALNIDGNSVVYGPQTTSMPEAHAKHPYAAANGVKIHKLAPSEATKK